MARVEDNNEFYWDTFFVKVEDKLFCVPRHEFIKSSKVFADMFLLPSGPQAAARSGGRDRDHPIVLDGYKDEFTCLLKVMYPTARSLIPGRNVELNLKKEEWVSVLKLSTIWNMTKIRQHAIHSLSSNITLSPIEKILLARAHRVGAWLGEAVTSLATCNSLPTFEDLATLGWETVARILWIRHNLSAIWNQKMISTNVTPSKPESFVKLKVFKEMFGEEVKRIAEHSSGKTSISLPLSLWESWGKIISAVKDRVAELDGR